MKLLPKIKNPLNIPKGFLKVLLAHKILLISLLVFTALVAGSLSLRQNLVHSLSVIKHVKPFNDVISLATPSPVPSPDDNPHQVLGASTDTSSDSTTDVSNNSVPTTPPLPDPTPIPTPAPTTTTTASYTAPSNSTGGSGSSNPNCTSGSGVPNFWYSIFTPSSPVNVGTSTTITILIKDCSKNTVGSDSLSISLDSGGSSVQLSNTSLTTSNGTASFTVSSQTPTTAKLTIKDTTNNFNVTDASNNSLTINFSGGTSNSSNCSADGDAYYSNAYFPSSSVSVGSKATISFDLRDCNNQATLGSDTITVTPVSVDSSFQFVGYGSGAFTLPQGQTSFQVTSQNSGNNTFKITDTTRRFDITGPHYSTPSVTFSGSNSSNTTSSGNSSSSSSNSSNSNTSTNTATSSGNVGTGST